MSEGFTCRGCGNFFFQGPKCVGCGAQKLYDSTVKAQWQQIETQTARIAELEAALDQLLDDMRDGLCVCQQAKDEARALMGKKEASLGQCPADTPKLEAMFTALKGKGNE